MEKIKEYMNKHYENLSMDAIDFNNFFNELEILFDNSSLRNKSSLQNKSLRKNILIIRLDAIGDYILTVPLIREIRKNYPNATITLVVSPLTYNLAETNPYVNYVYLVNGNSQYCSLGQLIIDMYKFCIMNLWDKNIDTAVVSQWGSDNLASILIAYLSGAVNRIGYGQFPFKLWFTLNELKEKLKNQNEYLKNLADYFFLNQSVFTDVNIVHEIDKHLYLLKYLDIEKEVNKSLELHVTEQDKKTVEYLKDVKKQKIVVSVGAGSPSAIYDVNKLNEALKLIYEEDNNVIFVIVGGVNNTETVKAFTVPIIDLTGKLTLRETAAAISLCDLYIGNDTGVMHMAATYHLPILMISREAKSKMNYKPGVYSSIASFKPLGTSYVIVQPEIALGDCRNEIIYGGCRYTYPHCINQIMPEQIYEGYKQLREMSEKYA